MTLLTRAQEHEDNAQRAARGVRGPAHARPPVALVHQQRPAARARAGRAELPARQSQGGLAPARRPQPGADHRPPPPRHHDRPRRRARRRRALRPAHARRARATGLARGRRSHPRRDRRARTARTLTAPCAPWPSAAGAITPPGAATATGSTPSLPSTPPQSPEPADFNSPTPRRATPRRPASPAQQHRARHRRRTACEASCAPLPAVPAPRPAEHQGGHNCPANGSIGVTSRRSHTLSASTRPLASPGRSQSPPWPGPFTTRGCCPLGVDGSGLFATSASCADGRPGRCKVAGAPFPSRALGSARRHAGNCPTCIKSNPHRKEQPR